MNKLLGLGHFEQVVRKSRFVAVCGPIQDAERAVHFIRTHGAKDCKHVCWAFRAGSEYRFDDAGEPSGTAGRPILAAIDQFELDFAMVVVNRYFGGIKLGTGGLARAFSNTAMQTIEHAIEHSGLAPIIAMSRLQLDIRFDFEAALYRLIEQYNGKRVSTEYVVDGLLVEVKIPSDQVNHFSAAVAERSRGQSKINKSDE